jgi:predicted Rossmann fold nucleotide-binding protein DprA/Smf involved in DNA uptake
MTRDEALLKLLAVEPETRDRLIVVTGWPVEETVATLERLVNEGRATYINGGDARIPCQRVYYPAP